MRRPRTSPTELINPIRLTMAVLVVVASSLALTARPAVAIPSYSLEERATAIASRPWCSWTSGSRDSCAPGRPGCQSSPTPVVVYNRCTGFVVNADGYVVTTTHCMKPASLRSDAVSVLADNLIRNGKLAAAERSAFLSQMQTADFTGASAGDAPKVTVKAQLYSAVTDSDSAKTIAATVVDSQAAADGETTLVKLDRRGLPVVQPADAQLPANLRVIMLGFAATSDASTNFTVNYAVRFQVATILGSYGNGAPPRSLLDRSIGPVTHGGMVADDDGKVLGMITGDTTANDQSNKIVTPTSTIANLLDANQVKNALGPMDQAYRAGLDAYFGGRYTEAINKLDSVLAASPDNAIAQTYRQQASVRLAVEGDGSTGNASTLVLAIVGGVLVLALGAVVAFMVVPPSRTGVHVLRTLRSAAACPDLGLAVADLVRADLRTSRDRSHVDRADLGGPGLGLAVRAPGLSPAGRLLLPAARAAPGPHAAASAGVPGRRAGAAAHPDVGGTAVRPGPAGALGPARGSSVPVPAPQPTAPYAPPVPLYPPQAPVTEPPGRPAGGPGATDRTAMVSDR